MGYNRKNYKRKVGKSRKTFMRTAKKLNRLNDAGRGGFRL